MEENQQKPKKIGFFRALFRGINALRLIIINVVFFIFFFSLLGIIGSFPAEDKKSAKKITSDCVLCVKPVGIASETEKQLFSIPISGFSELKTVLISDLTKAIKNAAYDRRIQSLYLDFSGLTGISSGHLAELGEVLGEFKNSGKKIYAYSSAYSISTYFLASYADRIGIDPLGSLSFTGFASRPVFYKGLEDKFSIKWNVLQAGDYKGMAETFSRENLSQPVRSNLKEMFDNLWERYVSDIAANRKISPDKIKNFAENHSAMVKKYSGDMATAALKEGLVTDIGSYYDFLAAVEFMNKDNYTDLVETIDYTDYNLNFTQLPGGNSIGIIHLEGMITSVSAGQNKVAVSSKIVGLFDRALTDPSIKAIVLRIDSGGGEVFASEEIRRAVKKARARGIPVVVSMGSVAASGAYWISSSADYIFASPYTVTGSIGVLGTMPSFQKALKEHLGITSDLVYAGQKPTLTSLQDPTEEEKEIRRLHIMDIYKKFIQFVSEGRNLPFETVADLAGGRVYDGEHALKLKLVDALGSLNDAIKYAAKLGVIENNFSVKEIKKPLTATEEFFKKFLQNLDAGTLENLATFPLADLRASFEFLQLNSKDGIYLYTPEKLIWE